MSKQKKPDRLAMEADAALSEGMSYGKWKARQFEQNGRKPVYYPEEWEDSDCGDTVCQDCGQLFMGGEFPYDMDNDVILLEPEDALKILAYWCGKEVL